MRLKKGGIFRGVGVRDGFSILYIWRNIFHTYPISRFRVGFFPIISIPLYYIGRQSEVRIAQYHHNLVGFLVYVYVSLLSG